MAAANLARGGLCGIALLREPVVKEGLTNRFSLQFSNVSEQSAGAAVVGGAVGEEGVSDRKTGAILSMIVFPPPVRPSLSFFAPSQISGSVPYAGRDPGLDAGRGLAMVLVVLGHALIGVMAAGADSRGLRAALLLIYSAHVPLLFAVSGLLAGAMVARPWRQVVPQMAARLVWPYLLWGFVLYSAHAAMGTFTNTALTQYQPWRILWHPPGVMWFLPVLGLGLITLRIVPRGGWPWVGAGLLLAPYFSQTVPQELRFAGGLVLLAAVGRARLTALWQRPGMARLAILGTVAVMAATAGLAWQQAALPLAGYPGFDPAYLPALVAGPLAVMGLAGRLGRGLWARIGRHTMPIFTTHVLITAGCRIGLQQAGLTAPALAVGLGSVLGVMGPLWVGEWAARRGLSPWLGWR